MNHPICRYLALAGQFLLAGVQITAAPYPNAPDPWRPVYEMDLAGFSFSHPMTVVNAAEMVLVKKRVAAGLEPQLTAYGVLIEEADSALGFVPDPPGVMDIMGGYEPNSNLAEMRAWLWRNCHAAYSCALAWAHTGDARYADKTVEVLSAWATKGTIFTGHDRGLQLGSHFSQMLYAADLVHGYAGWNATDRSIFESWWRNNVLVHTLEVMRTTDNNWKDAGLLGVMAAAAVFEDTLLLKESLVQVRSYFEERYDANVADKGIWKIKSDANGVYLPREVTRNDGVSGLTYTGYALTSMVQAFEIARYAGFDLWADTTAEGAGITGVIAQVFRWNDLGEPFPWNAAPTIRTTYKNAYEQARFHNAADAAMTARLDSLRPVDGTTGDEYVTLNRGGLEEQMGYVMVSCLDSATGNAVASAAIYGKGGSGDTYYGYADASGTCRFYMPGSTALHVRARRLGYTGGADTATVQPGTTVVCTVRMSALRLTGLEISAPPTFLCLSDSVRFTAAAVAEDGGRIPVSSGLVWQTTDTAVASVESGGMLYSRRVPGTAVLACSSVVTGFTDTVQVMIADRLRYRLSARADAYVRDGSYADANFGSADGLTVKQSIAGYTRWSYLMFDLTGLPADAEIDSAVLGLYVSGNDLVYPETMPVSVFGVADTVWTETGITWHNRPAAGESLATTAVPDKDKARYFWDMLSGFSGGLFVPGRTAGICLQNRGGTDNVVTFASRETGGTGPYLEIYMPGPDSLATGLAQADNTRSIRVTLFPNPVHDAIMLETAADTDITVLTIYDRTGSEIHTVQVNGGSPVIRYCPAIPAGIYFYRIQTAEGFTSGSFIKTE